MRRSLSLLLAATLACPAAFAWWETGHQTVARIAAAHLTPAARTRVARILDVPDTPEAVADALAKSSTWADETKKETQTGSWHYVDLTLEDTKADIPKRCLDNNCAPARIRLFAAQLATHPSDGHRSEAAAPALMGTVIGLWSDLDALRYVVHFVGDIHQPLHAISNADLGGNCELLDPPVDRAKNLHALWDGGIIDEMTSGDRALATDLEAEIRTLGAPLQREASQGNQDDWAWESHEVARKNIYFKLHIPLEPAIFPAGCAEAPLAITEFRAQADGLYVDSMKPVIRHQLELAGLRLAKVLNESL